VSIRVFRGERRLTPEVMIRAYSVGIFPMAVARDDPTIQWVAPMMRGILPLDGFHVPRRLRRTVRQAPFEVTFDTAFAQTIAACAAPRPRESETWINSAIRTVFEELHDRKLAHSVECWQHGRLVGGLYGLALGAAFFGESMFSTVTDASKVALVHLVARLRYGGFHLLDAQFLTEHLTQFGCVEVPAAVYQTMLRRAVAASASFHSSLPDGVAAGALSSVLRQSITQTS
jgi:leucyl/phenylalanyl-tRNA--protein transferase